MLNMIEIFSKNPDFIILEDDAVLTPLLIDDEISSLSAILLNEAYYELLKTGQKRVDGIPVLSPTCLIPFKAKVWLGLKERKLNGDQAFHIPTFRITVLQKRLPPYLHIRTSNQFQESTFLVYAFKHTLQFCSASTRSQEEPR